MTGHSDLAVLRESLRFAVPLAIRELEHRALTTRDISEAWLIGAARRAATQLGGHGDGLQPWRQPNPPRVQRTVTRVWGDVATGVAAAALLAGADGVAVLGDTYRPQWAGVRPCPLLDCATPWTGHLQAWPPVAAAPRTVDDLALPEDGEAA